MADRLQVIPLDLLLDLPQRYSRRGRVATVRLWLRTAVGRFALWQWCLGFTLCHSLVGSILLLYAVNPYGISSSMLAPGIMYPVCMLLPVNRRQPMNSLATTYFVSGVLTFGFAVVSVFS